MNLHAYVAKIALALPEVTVAQPFGADCDVYKVADKMFALASTHENQPMVNLKVEPDQGELLRTSYDYIHPAWYMNKQHWVSVYDDDVLDLTLLEELIITSYELVVAKLKKVDKLRIASLRQQHE